MTNMQFPHRPLQYQITLLVSLISTISATPVTAETASNFGTLKLSPNFDQSQGTITGYTGGSYPLSTISNRDQNKKACIGFADPKPDHILVLEKNFENLQILVDSGGKDTTLFVQGPNDETIRCGDDTGRSKDASVSDVKWKNGTYRIWVGTFNPGVKYNYSLTIQEQIIP